MEFDREAYQVAAKLMEYLNQHGWTSTLSLIRELQQKDDKERAKIALEEFETNVAHSSNPEFIISYARDIRGADLRKLLDGLLMIEDDLEICTKSDSKLYKKICEYKSEICALIDAQKTKISDSDIRDLFNRL